MSTPSKQEPGPSRRPTSLAPCGRCGPSSRMARSPALLALPLLCAAAGCFGPGTRDVPQIACWTEEAALAGADSAGWLGVPSPAGSGVEGEGVEVLLRLESAAPRGRL